jgi:Enoyl-(Acyl carrier protein) reductase
MRLSSTRKAARALDITQEQLQQTFQTNIFGYFYMAKAALEHLKEGAAIINTTSVTAYKGKVELIDYSATKGAIVSFTRSLSQALVEKKIRVNAVAPGPIWTPLIPASFDEDKTAQHGAKVPMRRVGQPNEVAPCHHDSDHPHHLVIADQQPSNGHRLAIHSARGRCWAQLAFLRRPPLVLLLLCLLAVDALRPRLCCRAAMRSMTFERSSLGSLRSIVLPAALRFTSLCNASSYSSLNRRIEVASLLVEDVRSQSDHFFRHARTECP